LKYKILICGVGSIGERHLRNLLTLKYDDIILYRRANNPLRTINVDFPVFTSLPIALEEKPDIAFICNPSHLHIQTAIDCAKAGCHLFIEKPLSNNLDGIDELNNIIQQKNKQVMIGYMLRFHPLLLQAKEWLSNKMIGKVIYARSQWGEYLPNWHPWEDYSNSYAANREMGGGAALTLSHDIDTMLWLFGKVKAVKGLANYNSNLKIKAEHAADILLDFKSGITANIHLDYFQKTAIRNLEVIGDKGKIYFDYFKNHISLIPCSDKGVDSIVKTEDRFERNDLFIDELKYFFSCLKNRIQPIPDINSSKEVIEIALSCT